MTSPRTYLGHGEGKAYDVIDLIEKQQERIRALEATVLQLWYSPGMPGALGAKAEFEEAQEEESDDKA